MLGGIVVKKHFIRSTLSIILLILLVFSLSSCDLIDSIINSFNGTDTTDSNSMTDTLKPEPTGSETIKPDSKETETTKSEPTDTTKPEPTDTTKSEPTDTAKSEPTDTAKPEPTDTAKPEPTDTAKPEPTDTTKPEPTDTAKPEPTDTAKPEPTDTTKPEPTDTAKPEPTDTTIHDSTGTVKPEDPVDPPHTHSYGKKVIAPTCTAQGYTVYTCSCGDTYIADYVKKADHDLEKKEVLPNCTVAGVREVHCKNCDYQKVDILLATNHSFGAWVVDTPPTTESNGIEKRYCSKCGDYQTRGIPKLNQPSGEFSTVEGNTLFGYDSLSSYTNSDSLKEFYKDIEVVCRQFHDNGGDVTANNGAYVFGTVNFGNRSLTIEQARMVKQVFDLDHPRYFWLSGAYYFNSNSISLCVYEEYAKASARNSIDAQIKTFLDEFKTATASMTTRYKKALYVHDALISRIDYKFKSDGITPSDDTSAHNVVGMVQKLGGVCEAYSKSYQMILSYIGVDCINVIGLGNGSGHAWNVVLLDDGKWYNVDVTWDDYGTNGTGYKYFGLSNMEFAKTHSPYSSSLGGNSFMFKYDVPQDDIDLTPMVVYKNGSKISDCGTFADAFALMIDDKAEYTIKLLLNTSDYVLNVDIPNTKSVIFTGDIQYVSSNSFYRSTLYLGADIWAYANVCIENIALSTLAGSNHSIVVDNKNFTIQGSQTTVTSGVTVSCNEFVSKLSVSAFGCNIVVKKLTLPDNTQLVLLGGTHKIDQVDFGKQSYLRLENGKVVLDIGKVHMSCPQNYAAIILSGDLGHELRMGDISGDATYLMLQVKLSALNKFPSITIGESTDVDIYFDFSPTSQSCDISTYDGVVFNAPSLDVNKVYYFIGLKQVINMFEIVNGECRVK